MMLGIAASNVIRKDTGVPSQRGAYSAMNTAAATPMGPAMSTAITDVTTVPKM